MKYAVTVGAIAAMIATITCCIYGASRLVYNMAQDGLFFSVFSTLTSSSRIPMYSVILNAFMSLLVAIFFDLELLVELLSIGTLTAYTMVSICLLILRYDEFNEERFESVPLTDMNHESRETHGVCAMGDVFIQKYSWVATTWPFTYRKDNLIKLALFGIFVDGIGLIFIIKHMAAHSASWWLLMLLVICIVLLFVFLAVISVYKQQPPPEGAFKVIFSYFIFVSNPNHVIYFILYFILLYY